MGRLLTAELAPYAARYPSDDPGYGVPLVVTAELRPGSGLIAHDPVNLDNLLARAVVEEATAGRGLAAPASGEWYDLPVPLRCLWRDAQGRPLWAATPFATGGASASDVWFWHKRAQPGTWTRPTRRDGTFTIPSTDGRWMERRVPRPVLVAERVVARAVGDPEEVARLLARITHLGKHRAVGLGAVARWTVAPADTPFALVESGRLTRALPAEAVGLLPAGARPEGEPALVGWTPPQWAPWLFAPGWGPGTPVVPRC